MYRQQQANEELHRQTIDVLVKIVDVLNSDEIALICWHCGIQPIELMPVEDARHPDSLKLAA